MKNIIIKINRQVKAQVTRQISSQIKEQIFAQVRSNQDYNLIWTQVGGRIESLAWREIYQLNKNEQD